VVAPPGIGTRLRAGLAWNLVAAAAAQGGTFAVNLIVANLLGRRVFGEFAMVQATWLTVAAVAQLATGYTAAKYVAELRATDPDRAGRVLGLCAAVSAAMAGLAGLALGLGADRLASDVLHAPHLAPALRLVALAAGLAVFNGFQTGALAGLEAYRTLAVASAPGGAAAVLVAVGAARAGGLEAVLTGLVLSALLQWAALFLGLRAELRRHGIVARYVGLTREAGLLGRFTLPAALSGLVSMSALWLAQAWLARQPDGYEQLALYGAANSFRAMVLFFPAVAHGVGLSMLNNQRGLGDQARYRRVFWTSVGLATGSVVGGGLVAAGGGPWLLAAFGKPFVEAHAVLVVLMLAAIAEAVAAAVYQIVQAREQMWLSLLAVVLPRDAAIVLGSWLLAPGYGALGLAWSYALACGLALASVAVIVRRLGLGLGDRAPGLAPVG